ncbi:ead/Ea22-like family protein [Citrobacter freundii]|uniref:ead/Ea22-like family protein n=1 Tax=Citrobacter freundii TaxID=546 RepID=UPI001576788E|nr:ead/Ea22-like family protein [Citrobacter freundii]EMB4340267.1 ead/Ea22-like family protein [Citrobacter freundii]MBJ9043162.1 ead/Ea22-like family protein [Citrobacter freundii]NTY74994.1 ead/Ea22-like family protein [Citrobacter freundii]NUA11441.1 ead/Ea22-like family protein [Citrobacter freundii]HAT7546454.1 ead/Ea22-like family protein [Citrobacter freundii]
MNDITALSPVTPEMLASLRLSALNLAEGEMLSFEPAVVLELVEALEKAQQYAKERDEENQGLMLTVGRLRVEREALESRTVTVNPYPLATDKSQGWTIHPDLLHQIRERIGDDAENYDFSPSMEMVESVLLAAAGIQVIEGEGQ